MPSTASVCTVVLCIRLWIHEERGCQARTSYLEPWLRGGLTRICLSDDSGSSEIVSGQPEAAAPEDSQAHERRAFPC